jgi:hypothetical protein
VPNSNFTPDSIAAREGAIATGWAATWEHATATRRPDTRKGATATRWAATREHATATRWAATHTVPHFTAGAGDDNTEASEEVSRRSTTVTAAPADDSSPVHTATAGEQSWAAIAGTVTSQTALVIGLLYYFGWVRTQATFAYFGVDTSLIGYGTSDYVLRSVEAAFQPFIWTALITLALLGIHRFLIRRALDMPEGSRVRVGVQCSVLTLHLVGIGLAAVVITGMLIPDRVGRPLGLLVPVSLIVSVALLGYVAYLRSTHSAELTTPTRRLMQPTDPEDQDAETAVNKDSRRQCAGHRDAQSFDELPHRKRLLVAYGRWSSPRVAPHSRAQTFVLLVLGLLGMMWAVSLYAGQLGADVASRLVSELHNRSSVVIYSTERIAVAGTGVEVVEIVQPGSKYHYQYSGICLLAHSTDRYILLPMNWKRGRDRVFILRDNDSIRIDVATR